MKVSNSQDRLKEMMQVLGITQTDIVNRTGVQKSSLSNYINGRRTPRQDQLSIIADPYGISPAWLMGYDVPMMLSKQDTQNIVDDVLVDITHEKEYPAYIKSYIENLLNDMVYQSYIRKISELPEEYRQLVFTSIDRIYEAYKATEGIT